VRRTARLGLGEDKHGSVWVPLGGRTQWDIQRLGASLLRSNFEGRRAEEPTPTDRSGRATLLLDRCKGR